MELRSKIGQRGVSLSGLISLLAILALGAVLAMKVVPTITEYLSIKNAITSVKSSAKSVAAARIAFDKQAEVGYIDAINGKDLDIAKNGDEIEISFAYQKKIPLFGPASLVLDYAGTTAKNPVTKAAP